MIQEQVKVEQTAIWSPGSEDSVHLIVVGPALSPQPTLHLILTSHVVGGEHIQPAQPAQQDVLCGPAANAFKCNQLIERFSGLQCRKILQIQTSFNNPPRNSEHDSRFVAAETE